MLKDRYIDQNTFADIFNISPRTLERWRIEGSGPYFRKMNRRVYYKISDIEDFLERHKYTSTSQYPRKTAA